MRTGIVAVITALALAPRPASGQGTEPAGRFFLTPHLGVTSESDFVDGAVRFSDGDVDFISIEPGNGLLLGIEFGYTFGSKLDGILALSYATADARYIENGDLRPDANIDTIRIQPGVMYNVVDNGKVGVAVGGGVTLARLSLDRVVWNDRSVNAASTALGVFGAGGLDVSLSPRASLHVHLALEVTRPSYGDLEDGLAFADGEVASKVDHDLRQALLLALGVTIAL